MDNTFVYWKSPWFQVPMALFLAACVSLLTLKTFHLPNNSMWLVLLQPLYTALLYRRRVLDLAMVAALALSANFAGLQLGELSLNLDLMLGLVIAVILCPLLMRLLGFENYTPYA